VHGAVLLTGVGAVSMATAVALANVTLASGDYRLVLAAAAVIGMLAVGCFVNAFRRGGWVLRVVCVALALPLLSVVVEILRRGSNVFSQ